MKMGIYVTKMVNIYMNNTKICYTCKQEKSIAEFHKDRYKPDGLTPSCAFCRGSKKMIGESRVVNGIKKCSRCQVHKPVEEFYKDSSRYEGLSYYCKSCKGIRNKKYVKKNTEKIRSYFRDYTKTRKVRDVNFKLAINLRARVNTAIRDNIKAGHTLELLGCTIDELKRHLESKFSTDMSWDNYGQWHVDHIVPCSAFDLSDPVEQKQCFHYTNLQPLWAEDNMKKHDKWVV